MFITANVTNTIKEAIKLLDKTGIGFLCIYENNKIYGVITDGDIRRAILNDIALSEKVKLIANTDFIKLNTGYTKQDVEKTFKENDIKHIPVIKNFVLEEIIVKDSFFDRGQIKNEKKIYAKVVIMAGGKGTRLAPFTNIIPKPLIPIGEKTMLEMIMQEYENHKILDFYISVNYKASMIKAYFEEINHNYNIKFIHEDKPLGTAGALKFVENEFEKPFFVANCDIIIKADYSKVYDFHVQGNYDITLVASMQHYQIPYGVCEISKGGELIKINEKPEYDFLVNTGMYVLNQSVLKLIPRNTFFHITHLIEKVKESGGKVGVFPVSEKSWIDIGQMEEYKKGLSVLLK